MSRKHTILTGSCEHTGIDSGMDFNIKYGHKRTAIKDTCKYGQDAATVNKRILCKMNIRYISVIPFLQLFHSTV